MADAVAAVFDSWPGYRPGSRSPGNGSTCSRPRSRLLASTASSPPLSRGASKRAPLPLQLRNLHSPGVDRGRVYGVVVEPGAARSHRTPRSALRLAGGRSPELLRRCPGAPPAPSKTPQDCLNGGGAQRRQRDPGRTRPIHRPRHKAVESVDWDLPAPPPPLSAVGTPQASPHLWLRKPRLKPDSLVPETFDSQSSDGTCEGSIDHPQHRSARSRLGGGAGGAAGTFGHRPTIFQGMAGSGTGSAQELQDFFEFGRHGMRKVRDVEKHQQMVQDLERKLCASMTKSFPRDVWEACDLEHPDAIREEAERNETQMLRKKSTMAALRDRMAPGAARAPLELDTELERKIEEIENDRLVAILARDTGWEVIDVEEVRDVWVEHVGSSGEEGAVGAASEAFLAVLRGCYEGAGQHEVRGMVQQLKLQGLCESEEIEDDLRSKPDRLPDFDVRFGDFFMALVHWLGQMSTVAKEKHCPFRRFLPDYRNRRASGHSVRSSQEGSFAMAMPVSFVFAPPLVVPEGGPAPWANSASGGVFNPPGIPEFAYDSD